MESGAYERAYACADRTWYTVVYCVSVDTPLQIGVISTYLDHATCNQAEYSALILGLEVSLCLPALCLKHAADNDSFLHTKSKLCLNRLKFSSCCSIVGTVLYGKMRVYSIYMSLQLTVMQAAYDAGVLHSGTNLDLTAMQAAYDAGVRNIQVRGDSKLVVKQVCMEIIKICGPPCNKWI